MRETLVSIAGRGVKSVECQPEQQCVQLPFDVSGSLISGAVSVTPFTNFRVRHSKRRRPGKRETN